MSSRPRDEDSNEQNFDEEKSEFKLEPAVDFVDAVARRFISDVSCFKRLDDWIHENADKLKFEEAGEHTLINTVIHEAFNRLFEQLLEGILCILLRTSQVYTS